jgi:hypothetical protein
LALIGHFLNVLRFFKAKTAILCGRRDVIVGDVTSSLPTEQCQGGEGPPRQVWRGWDSFRIFYDFLKQNPPSRVTSSSVTSHHAYLQNDSGVARNLHAKFGADRTLSEFPTILQAKTAVPCGRRDVIGGDVTSSLPAEQFQGGEEPPRQIWHGWDSFRIFYDFFKQNPLSRAAPVTSSSGTSHRAYPQNDSGVAAYPQNDS